MPFNCIVKRKRGSKSFTTITPPCTPTSTRTVPTPSDILPSLNPKAMTSPVSLDSSTVELPYELYHPVLPYQCQNKLIFPPLSHLAPAELHTSQERALMGTWCSPELEEALQQGYKILKGHEIWHFSRQSITFLKIKQEASGLPEDVEDNPIKQHQYLLDYARHEGVKLDLDKITFNPGLRSLAKMMLNSFWGKFSQQANNCQVEASTSPAKFNELLHDDAKEIHSIRNARSGSQPSRRVRPHSRQHQHLHCLLHHLLGSLEIIPGHQTAPTRASALLSYRQHHLCLETWTPQTPSRKLPGGIHQRMETRGSYCGICRRRA